MHFVEAVDGRADTEVERLVARQRSPQGREHVVADLRRIRRLAHLHERCEMCACARLDPGEHGIGEGGPEMEPQDRLSAGGRLGEGEDAEAAGERQ